MLRVLRSFTLRPRKVKFLYSPLQMRPYPRMHMIFMYVIGRVSQSVGQTDEFLPSKESGPPYHNVTCGMDLESAIQVTTWVSQLHSQSTSKDPHRSHLTGQTYNVYKSASKRQAWSFMLVRTKNWKFLIRQKRLISYWSSKSSVFGFIRIHM